jgi:hypothetical protein
VCHVVAAYVLVTLHSVHMALRLSSLLLLLLSAGIFPFLRTMYLIRRIEKPCWIPLARSSVMLAQRSVKGIARLINCDRSWYDASFAGVFWCVVAANGGSCWVYQAAREVLLGDSRRTASQLQSSLVRH